MRTLIVIFSVRGARGSKQSLILLRANLFNRWCKIQS